MKPKQIFMFCTIFVLLFVTITNSPFASAGISTGATKIDACGDGTDNCLQESQQVDITCDPGFTSCIPGSQDPSTEQLFTPAPVAATKILHIGDSHTVGSYGRLLHKQFQQLQYDIHTFGCGGADANTFFAKNYGVCTTDTKNADGTIRNPKEAKSIILKNDQKSNFVTQPGFDFQHEITTYQPNIIIISLGTNFVTEAGVLGEEAQIRDLLQKAKLNSQTCYWVGAPVTKSPKVFPNAINNALRNIVVSERCIFIDATTISDPRKLTSGKVHFSDATMWATGVVDFITQGRVSENTIPIPEESEDYNSGDGTEDQSTSDSTFSPTSTNTALKQFDDAWIRFANLVNPSLANKVFLPGTGFVEYRIAYPSPIISTSSPSSTTTTSLSRGTITPEQIAIINQLAPGIGIDSKLGISLVKHESSGNPNAISNTGCAGLMQVCSVSAVRTILPHTCPQNKINGPRNCPDGQPDDRFDQYKNIKAGLTIMKQKMDQIQGKGFCAPGADETKCAIASYNAGAGVVIKAAQRAKAAGNQNPTWAQVYAQITPDLLKSVGYTSSYWTQERLESKIRNLNPYVERIYRAAQ